MTIGIDAVDESFEGQFRYFVCNAFTGDILEQLPFSTFEFDRIRNKPGGWTADISYRNPKLTTGLIAPWTRSVFAELEGTILWGGLLTTTGLASDGPYKLGGAGFFEYYREGRRVLRDRGGMTYATGANDYIIEFAGVEQFDIVSDFLAHAADFAGPANLGYDEVRYHGPGQDDPSGVDRDRTYYTYERKGIGEAIEQMAEVIDGFDFSESYAFSTDGSRIERYLDLWYPYKGNDQVTIFALGNNVVLLNRDVDGLAQATRVTSTGDGEDDAQLQREAVNGDTELPDGYLPMLEATTSYSDVSIPSTLTAHAEFDAGQLKNPVDSVELEVQKGIDVVLGEFDWGDSVRTVADDHALQLDAIYRIESLHVGINENGSVTIKPQLAELGASIGEYSP